MKRHVLVTALDALLVAACGSSAGSGATSASPAQTTPTPSVSAIASCDELKVAAAHVTTFVHYIALNVGSDNDASAYFTERRDTVASLQASQAVRPSESKVQLAPVPAGVGPRAAASRDGHPRVQPPGQHPDDRLDDLRSDGVGGPGTAGPRGRREPRKVCRCVPGLAIAETIRSSWVSWS